MTAKAVGQPAFPGGTTSLQPLSRHRLLSFRPQVRLAARIKLLVVLAAMGAVWLLLLFKLGVWRASLRPSGGVLSYTFDGWATYPVNRHYFLAQFEPSEFVRGKAYTSYSYPFLAAMFLLLSPLHYLLKLPFEVAHNFLPTFYAVCLIALLAAEKRQSWVVYDRKWLFRWGAAFLAVGVFVTNPLLWLLLVFNRDNFHVLAAASFCYLSTWVFYDEVPKKPLLLVGLFLALWSPVYIPAWILAGLVFNRALVVERGWLLQVAGICVLAGINIKLPAYVCGKAGLISTGSDLLYRSGLDGSKQYLSSIYQAVFSPVDPRRWPAAFYLVAAAALGGYGQYLVRKRQPCYFLRQAGFLLIPYSTIAILLPQFTSIHPYFADVLLIIPATFLIAFWSLQKEFWENLTGASYVTWTLATALVVMTNLLTITQNLKQ